MSRVSVTSVTHLQLCAVHFFIASFWRYYALLTIELIPLISEKLLYVFGLLCFGRNIVTVAPGAGPGGAIGAIAPP